MAENEYLIQGSTLTVIADAIRAKTKSTETILVSEMGEKILGIEAGGLISAKKTVELAMVGGNQVITPDEGTLLSEVTVIKPEGLLQENIKKDVDIGGIIGTLEVSKLNNPTVSLTSGTTYNTCVITNPTTNGNFADTLEISLGGELVSTRTAPSQGSSVSIVDLSLYNGIDGPQTINVGLKGAGVEDSDIVSVSTDMQGIDLTPEEINDNYGYVAIKTGATFTTTIDEKTSNSGFLPLKPSVIMGETATDNYTWEYDLGNGGDYGLLSRSTNGKLIVPNVTEHLYIDIPLTEKPQQAEPVIINVDGIITITPSPYASQVQIYIDNIEYKLVQGLTYSHTKGSMDNGVSVTVTPNDPKFSYFLGNKPTSGTQLLTRFYFTAVEETPLQIRATYYNNGNSDNNYLILSKLDKALSTTSYTDDTANIQQSFSGLSSSSVYRTIDYTVPIGTHFIDMKLRGYTSSTGAVYSSFGIYKLCPSAQITLPDYKPHVVSAVAYDTDWSVASEKVELECQMLPQCIVINRKLTMNCLSSIAETIGIYINDVLVDTLVGDGSSSKTIDLLQYPYHEAGSTVYFKVYDEDGAHQSNTVTADLSIPILGINDNGYSLNISNIIDSTTSIDVYLNDTLVDTIEYNGSSSLIIDMSQYGTEGATRNSVYIITHGIIDITSPTILMYTNTQPIYGVSGLYASTVALTRTDDAINLTYTKNSDGTINSDFDNVFPWTDIKIVTDAKGNEFIQMPKMYFRIGYNTSSYYITDVAVSSIPGTTGKWYAVDPFCYGRYGASTTNNIMCSQRGVYRSRGVSRATYRSYASANGANYHQLDLYHRSVMMLLWWIEWATKDSSSIMTGTMSGTGTTGGTSVAQNGTTDSLTTQSGYELTRNRMRWHYIEDYIGTSFEFIDGIYANRYGSSYYHYTTANPANFSGSTTGKTALVYSNPTSSSYYCISAFGWDPNQPFMCMPLYTVSNTSYNTYFCDYHYISTGTYPAIYVGACAANSGTNYGLHYTYRVTDTAVNSNVGSRLIYAGTLE